MGYEVKLILVQGSSSVSTFTTQQDKTYSVYEDGLGHYYDDSEHVCIGVDLSECIQREFSRVVATVNLGKVGCLRSTRKFNNSDKYIFADDGDTPIVKDHYDKYLKESSIEEAIAWLKAGGSVDRLYWKYKAAIRLLEEALDSGVEGLSVLYYGY